MSYDMSGRRGDTDSPHRGGQAVARAAKIRPSTSPKPSPITPVLKRKELAPLSQAEFQTSYFDRNARKSLSAIPLPVNESSNVKIQASSPGSIHELTRILCNSFKLLSLWNAVACSSIRSKQSSSISQTAAPNASRVSFLWKWNKQPTFFA